MQPFQNMNEDALIDPACPDLSGSQKAAQDDGIERWLGLFRSVRCFGVLIDPACPDLSGSQKAAQDDGIG